MDTDVSKILQICLNFSSAEVKVYFRYAFIGILEQIKFRFAKVKSNKKNGLRRRFVQAVFMGCFFKMIGA